jgi:hypothetical protein
MSWESLNEAAEIKRDETSPAQRRFGANDVSVFLVIEFVSSREPVFEYDTFFSESRNIAQLADEQNRSRLDFDSGLEDVDLPPDRD